MTMLKRSALAVVFVLALGAIPAAAKEKHACAPVVGDSYECRALVKLRPREFERIPLPANRPCGGFQFPQEMKDGKVEILVAVPGIANPEITPGKIRVQNLTGSRQRVKFGYQPAAC